MSTTQKAYQYIRERLLVGDFAPNERLREERLAADIGVSRTPVRHAFHMLECEGLLEHRPNVGAVVSVPDQNDAVELLDMREMLEVRCLERVAGQLSDDCQADLEACVQEMERITNVVRDAGLDRLDGELRRRWLQADMRFHRLISEQASGPFTCRLTESLQILLRNFAAFEPTLTGDLVPLLTAVCREHQDILTALREGDAAAAIRVFRHGMQLNREVILCTE